MAAFCPARATDWPPITPEQMAMKDSPQQPGAPAIVLIRQETDDDTMHYHEIYMRIKVLTDEGRKYANVEIPYERRHLGVSSISGRTVHADGTIVPFEGKPFDKDVHKEHNLRIRVKSFNLPDVQVGSILDYRYDFRYDDHDLFPPTWIVQGDLFEQKVMFKFVPYMKEWENSKGRTGYGAAWTNFLPNNRQPQLHESPQNSFGVPSKPDWIDLEMDDVAPLAMEPYSPPASPLKWRVEFYYRSGDKPEDYWKEEGKDWNKEVESFMGKKKGLSEEVAQLTAGADSPEQKVRKIYYFVSRLENHNYDPPRAVQEQQALGMKPIKGAEDVLQDKGGDHDELNRLFVAMVRAAGIPAWLMRVPDRSETFFEQALLSTDQFDAEIAIVQINGKEVFLDPGTKFCPYGLMDWRYMGCRGLRQSASKGTEIGFTDMPNYTEAMTQRMARLKLSDRGTIEGDMAVGFYGLEAMNWRQEAGKTDDEGRKKLLEDEIRSWLPGGSEVSMTEPPAWPNTEVPLVAKFHISSPLATSAGRRWIVPVHVLQVNRKSAFASNDRQNPVYFDYPSREIDEVHITIPAGMEVESLPANDHVKLDYALYITTQKQESPQTIMAVRDVAMGGALFGKDEYKELKGFYDKVKAGDDQPAILKGAVHAAAN